MSSHAMSSRLRSRVRQRGTRQLNVAIYRVVIVRMQHHEPTKAYVARRTTEGKSKRDIIREVYQLIKVNPRTGETTS